MKMHTACLSVYFAETLIYSHVLAFTLANFFQGYQKIILIA